MTHPSDRPRPTYDELIAREDPEPGALSVRLDDCLVERAYERAAYERAVAEDLTCAPIALAAMSGKTFGHVIRTADARGWDLEDIATGARWLDIARDLGLRFWQPPDPSPHERRSDDDPCRRISLNDLLGLPVGRYFILTLEHVQAVAMEQDHVRLGYLDEARYPRAADGRIPQEAIDLIAPKPLYIEVVQVID